MAGTVVAGQKLTSALLGMPAWSQMSLINSWTNHAGDAAGQYRYWPLTNELEIIGTLQHASTSGISQFCSTFASNLPASRQRDIALEVVLTSPVQISYATNGVLEFAGMPSTSTIIEFHCWLSLDS